MNVRRQIEIPTLLVILAILLACTTAPPEPSSTETPTPRGIAATPVMAPNTPEPEATATRTSSPEPATTVIPTAAPAGTPTSTPTPQPTVTSGPTPTPAPKPTVTSGPTPRPALLGALAPLPLQDPQALLSSVSDAELDCIGGPERLVGALAGLGSPAPDALAEIFGCMEDETLTRLFLASFVPVTDPLSSQSSQCVRAAFDVIEPRKVMTVGLEGDPGAAMAGSMAALTVTVACLNDEEWEAVGPEMGMRPEERAGMQCLMEALGGPREIAAAMKMAQEGDLTSLARAAAECGLDMGAPPGQAPTPVPLPTQVNQAPSQAQDVPALTDGQVAKMNESISSDPILTVMLQGGYTINDYGPWVAGDRTLIGAIAEIFLTTPMDYQGTLPMVGFEPAEDGSKEYLSGTFNITATGIRSLIILVDIAEEEVVGIEIGGSETVTLSVEGE